MLLKINNEWCRVQNYKKSQANSQYTSVCSVRTYLSKNISIKLSHKRRMISAMKI